MANIGNKNIYSGDDYLDVETDMSLSLTIGSKYTIQIKGDDVVVCEAATKPTTGGFYPKDKPFTYTKGSDKLWVKIPNKRKAYFNIAEA